MLTLAAIFSDDMVLQRDKPIPVWGKGEAGRTVMVNLGSEAASTTVDGDGLWQAVLSPLNAGASMTMTVSDGSEILTRQNVRMGEVWFAGGQSNMEMGLQDCRNGKREVANSGGRNVFFYDVPKRAVRDSEQRRMETESRWKPCSPETSHNMSAVAYFFACYNGEGPERAGNTRTVQRSLPKLQWEGNRTDGALLELLRSSRQTVSRPSHCSVRFAQVEARKYFRTFVSHSKLNR